MCPRPRFRYFTFLLNPAPLLLESLYLALDKLAFERGRAVEEDYAVAVIRLVQHAARFQFESVELELLAVQVLRADDCAQRPLHRKEDAGERETALVADQEPELYLL